MGDNNKTNIDVDANEPTDRGVSIKVNSTSSSEADDTNQSDKTDVSVVEEVSTNVATPVVAESGFHFDHNQTRKYILYTLGLGVAVTAVISIVAVLIGEMNEYVWRSLGTTLSMVLHASFILSLISFLTARLQVRKNPAIVYVVIGLTIASFLLTFLVIWEFIDSGLFGRMYNLLISTFLLAWIIYYLLTLSIKDRLVKITAFFATAVSSGLYLLVAPLILSTHRYDFPEMYIRSTIALSILVASSAIVAAIANKLYLGKLPKDDAQRPAPRNNSALHITIIILIALYLWVAMV